MYNYGKQNAVFEYMPNMWFRMYDEWADDPKVQMMPEVYQRRLVMIFCLTNKADKNVTGDVTLQDSYIAFQLRIDPDEWQKTKREFIQRGFIDKDNKLIAWGRRQFRSDSSATRVRAYRDRVKQERNVTVTPPDTDTDTDTDTDNKKPKGFFAAVIKIPLKDNTEYEIPAELVCELTNAYKTVNVPEELKKCRAWNKANVSKRKTKRGIKRHLHYWISSVADRQKQQSINKNDQAVQDFLDDE